MSFQVLATADAEGKVTPVCQVRTEKQYLKDKVIIFEIKEIPKKVFGVQRMSRRERPVPPEVTGSCSSPVVAVPPSAPTKSTSVNAVAPKSRTVSSTSPPATKPTTPAAPVSPTQPQSSNTASSSTSGQDEKWDKIVAAHDGTNEHLVRKAETVFRQGPHEVPTVAPPFTGKHLAELVRRSPPSSVPESSTQGLKVETRKAHLSILKRVAEAIKKDTSDRQLEDMHLEKAVTAAIDDMRKDNNWKASTTLKNAASLQGALKILPLYCSGSPSIKLSFDPFWTQSMRARQIAAREETPSQPTPATVDQIMQVVVKTERDPVAIAILLGWLTAARLGCIRQLAKKDIVVDEKGLSITFRRGKGVRASQPYTVHTVAVPSEVKERWQRYLESRETKMFPDNLKGDELKKAIREAGPQLEQRSIRRGALQAMATKGTSDELLMLYSGHKRKETLHRYLNWNMVNTRTKTMMRDVGQALLPTTSSESPLQPTAVPPSGAPGKAPSKAPHKAPKAPPKAPQKAPAKATAPKRAAAKVTTKAPAKRNSSPRTA